MTLTTTAAALVLLAAAGTLVTTDLRPGAVARFGRRAGLPGAPTGRAEDRLRRRALVGAAGALAGGLGVAVWMTAARITAGDVAMTLVWAAVGALVARAAAVAGLALVGVCRPPAAGPRVTRASRTGVADYVPPGETAVAVVAGVAPAALLAVASLLPGGNPVVWPVIAAPAALVVAGVVAARIVARPQPAAGRLELAWDDALRARTLRDLVAGAVLVGAGYGLLSVAVLGTVPAPGAVTAVLDAVFVALAVLAVLVTAWPGPGQHVRRRLWADDVAPSAAVTASSS